MVLLWCFSGGDLGRLVRFSSSLVLPIDFLHKELNAHNSILSFHRYQFNPGLSSPHIVVQILLLSLTSSTPSSSDFSLSLALALDRPPSSLLPGIPVPSEDDDDDEQIDSRDYVGEVVDVLQELAKLLKECRYREFWKVWSEGGGEGGDRA